MYTTGTLNCELLGVSLQFKDVLSLCVHPRTCVAKLLQMKSEMDRSEMAVGVQESSEREEDYRGERNSH